jgi:hypothetical protein
MVSNIPFEARVVLTGVMTLQSTDAVHAQLLQMGEQPLVEIDCSGMTEADVGIVQLILAARVSARKADRTVVLAQPATGVLLEILQRGGFLHADADPSDPDNAFWLKTTGVS